MTVLWTPGRNGHHPPINVRSNMTDSNGAGTSMDEIIAGLRGKLVEAEDELARYQAGLEERRQDVAQIRKALQALDPSSRPSKANAARKRNAPDWHISGEKVRQVWDVVARIEEPFTRTQVVEQVGLAHESVRRALDVLRTHERIRISGSTRGGGKQFKRMPGAESKPLPDSPTAPDEVAV